MYWFFFFFIVSGFCSLVYQVTWLRVAMAAFGVTTPLVAMMLSIFMTGLALGSWGGGALVSRRTASARALLLLYGAMEALIGLGGFAVAPLLGAGKQLLQASSLPVWGSSGYYHLSGLLLTAILLPFCTCMGATFPVAMAAFRGVRESAAAKSFSFLYVANLAGALAGTACSAFILIELLGFRRTMEAAAYLNLLVAVLVIVISLGRKYARMPAAVGSMPTVASLPLPTGLHPMLLLFITGSVSLAMEVVWTRLFVPFLGPVVYTFAAILAIYLMTTLAGSQFYRFRSRIRPVPADADGWFILTAAAGAAALLPLVLTDVRLPLGQGLISGLLRVLIGIGPFCMLLGFLTPAIIDRMSGGNAVRAGNAYAVNTLGCIVGPLLAGFLLLPWCGERWSLVLLALPLLGFGVSANVNSSGMPSRAAARFYLRSGTAAILLLAVAMAAMTRGSEQLYPGAKVLRDHTATVIATGEGLEKQLLVNGVGMTKMTPITKMMVHLPLASLQNTPRKGLVLCLGMGTSYRSMMSWGVATTAVELIPSVPSLLPFFHGDGERLLADPGGRIEVDDARRFLERSREFFDVIVVDPPPPIEAAASSLLHSREFYAAVAKRLAPGGILQQWIPWLADGFEDASLLVSMTRALQDVFPHIRAFGSLEGWGIHFIASMTPITARTASGMTELLPPRAAIDLVEWGPHEMPQKQFAQIMAQELRLQDIIALAPSAPMLTDDRPFNEYFLLRQHGR